MPFHYFVSKPSSAVSNPFHSANKTCSAVSCPFKNKPRQRAVLFIDQTFYLSVLKQVTMTVDKTIFSVGFVPTSTAREARSWKKIMEQVLVLG